MARTLLTLADGTARDLELAGLSATSASAPGASVQLQGASVAELSGARLGPVQLTGLAVNSPDAGLTFEAARHRMDFDPFPLAELRAAATQLPRTPEGAAELRRQLAAVTGRYEGGVDRLVIDGRESGVKAGAGQLRFAGSTDALRTQTQVGIDALALELGRTPGGGSGPGSLARALGDLTGSMRAAWSTDRRAGTASLESMGLDLDGLAAIQADGVAGMPADGSTLGPDPAAFSLVRGRLVYTDRSLLQRLLTAWGEPSGLAPEMVADAFAGMIADPSTTPWLNRPARTALAQFLRQPGRLQIELAPAAPLKRRRAAGPGASAAQQLRRHRRPAGQRHATLAGETAPLRRPPLPGEEAAQRQDEVRLRPGPVTVGLSHEQVDLRAGQRLREVGGEGAVAGMQVH